MKIEDARLNLQLRVDPGGLVDLRGVVGGDEERKAVRSSVSDMPEVKEGKDERRSISCPREPP
jgi:hypothetical protein